MNDNDDIVVLELLRNDLHTITISQHKTQRNTWFPMSLSPPILKNIPGSENDH